MNRNITILTTFVMLAIAISGCFPDNDRRYQGPLQIEFRPVSETFRMSEGIVYQANVQLIGPHQSEDIVVEFSFDSDASSAEMGIHFELSGLTAVIPANSSFAQIPVTVIWDEIDSDRPVVVLTLVGDTSGEVLPAENYKSLSLTLRR